MTSNVIMFPKGKKGSPPQTMEELLETVEEARREHVEFVIDETLSFVFSRCYEEGFDLNKDHCVKTTALVVESLRAAMYNTVGIEHPLFKVADTIFVSEEEAAAHTEKILDEIEHNTVTENTPEE